MIIQHRMGRVVSTLAGLALVLTGAARADILVQGNTSGAFYQSSSNLGSSVLSLSFTGNNFGPQSSTVPLNLGQFSLTCGGLNTCNDNYVPYDFRLTVTFSVPAGAGATVVSADVTGRVQGFFIFGNTDTVGVNFGGPTLVSYSNASGSGQFYLTVNDIAAGGIPVLGSTTLTASISGDTFVPTVSANPEPASIVMLGSMVGIVGIWMRKRRSA